MYKLLLGYSLKLKIKLYNANALKHKNSVEINCELQF